MLRRLRVGIFIGVFYLLACSSLPPLDDRTQSESFSPALTANTAIGQMVVPLMAEHPGKSGILSLPEAKDAFAARLVLAGAAEQSLDVQYYIWRDDKTGLILLQALYNAAQRGVRVRLLLDDLNSSPVESKLLALNEHPNIEVRLFNPFVIRGPRTFGFITDFSRANRRMHNKSFTADNQATIIGGRNVGDDYFSGSDGVLFADLDALAVGPVVNDVSVDFDRFWSSASAYPVDQIARPLREETAQQTMRRLYAEHEDALLFMENIQNRELFHGLLNGDVPLIWATTQMVSDDPRKALGKAEDNQLITYELRNIIGQPQHSVYLVSPYFVPTRTGVDALIHLAESGVDIHVLTNSYEATDVAIVHAGYAKWRKPLLEAGIRLYEMRSSVAGEHEDELPVPRFGSSASSLHAKTFAVDGERVFIGSFNFDPRSAQLNTELGFIIESPELAEQTAAIFREEVPFSAYELRLSSQGRLYWLQRDPGYQARYDTDPGSTWMNRAAVRFFSWLPIDWLL